MQRLIARDLESPGPLQSIPAINEPIRRLHDCRYAPADTCGGRDSGGAKRALLRGGRRERSYHLFLAVEMLMGDTIYRNCGLELGCITRCRYVGQRCLDNDLASCLGQYYQKRIWNPARV